MKLNAALLVFDSLTMSSCSVGTHTYLLSPIHLLQKIAEALKKS